VNDAQPGSTTLRVRMELAIAGGLVGGAIALVIHQLTGLGGITTGVVVAIVLPVGFRKGQVLELAPDGVTCGEREGLLRGSLRSATWTELELTKGMAGYAIRTPKGTAMRSRLSIAPAMYERGWRDGTIGAQLRRWAPHLLPPGDAA
jgi:hypothetical protein